MRSPARCLIRRDWMLAAYWRSLNRRCRFEAEVHETTPALLTQKAGSSFSDHPAAAQEPRQRHHQPQQVRAGSESSVAEGSQIFPGFPGHNYVRAGTLVTGVQLKEPGTDNRP